MTENISQQLIEELRNMTDLEDDEEEEEEEHLHLLNTHPRLPLLIDPILQNQQKAQKNQSNQSKPSISKTTKVNKKSNKRSVNVVDSNQNLASNPRKGKKPNLNRDHLGANEKLIHDFFQNHHHHDQNDNLVSDSDSDLNFFKFFNLSKKLFLKIVRDLTKNDLHFTQRKDALGNLGHSSYQKVLVAFRQLTHGIGNQEVIMDSYIRMAESTALESLIRFCHNINEIYGKEYLRRPNEEDVSRIKLSNKKRGIPEGYMGSLNYKYWQWDNRPTGWSGRFKSSSGALPTIVLEALVSPHDSWFWYAFFSTPGNCKDIDVFHPNLPIYSPCFQPPQPSAYYHAPPIYPPIKPIVSSINNILDQTLLLQPGSSNPNPIIMSHSEFDTICRQDFDSAMHKLESRFQIIKLRCRLWSSNSMKIVLKTVLILHNMIVEDEREGKDRSLKLSNHSSHHDPFTTTHVEYSCLVAHPVAQTRDIQVDPPPPRLVLSHHLPASRPSSSSPSTLPSHVLQKLNHRFQFFNPNLSLTLPN